STAPARSTSTGLTCARAYRTAPRRFPRSCRLSKGAASRSPRSPPLGHPSTTSICTTRGGSSQRRTRPPLENVGRHAVDGPPPAPEPDARADLDRSAPDPADDLAPPLRAALLARPGASRRREHVRRVPAARARG